MTRSARVAAQAKVNLRLRVLGREVSGYHSIETVFLRLELADIVNVRITTGRSVECMGPAMPRDGLGPAEKNLAYRAACAYAAETGWPQGFAIEIEKHIPVGGGLGGGSADAGAVLRALDALSPCPIGECLVELAGPLGADVPFMTIESPIALGWGRGERLLTLPAVPPLRALVAVPDFSVSTAEAYSWLAASRGSYEPATALLTPELLGSWDSLAAMAVNDFGDVVAERHPVITELIEAFERAGALVAMMSGSGSAVFGLFRGGRIATPATQKGVKILATRTSSRVVGVDVRE